jgi:hypothetical protein
MHAHIRRLTQEFNSLLAQRRLAEAVADVACGRRAGSLGTGAALQLLLKHCPVKASAFPPEWGVFESAVRFVTSVRRGAAAATIRSWKACAAFVSVELRLRLPNIEFRAVTFSRMIAHPGAWAGPRMPAGSHLPRPPSMYRPGSVRRVRTMMRPRVLSKCHRMKLPLVCAPHLLSQACSLTF